MPKPEKVDLMLLTWGQTAAWKKNVVTVTSTKKFQAVTLPGNSESPSRTKGCASTHNNEHKHSLHLNDEPGHHTSKVYSDIISVHENVFPRSDVSDNLLLRFSIPHTNSKSNTNLSQPQKNFNLHLSYFIYRCHNLGLKPPGLPSGVKLETWFKAWTSDEPHTEMTSEIRGNKSINFCFSTEKPHQIDVSMLHLTCGPYGFFFWLQTVNQT